MLIAWSAVVEVCPSRSVEDWPKGATAAYVPILALAENESRLRERINQELSGDGFLLIALDDIKIVDLSKTDLGSDNANMLREFLSEKYPVQYSSFHTYSKDGLDG